MVGLTLLTEAYKIASISIGDLLTFICAFLWALQILLVGRLSKSSDALELAYSESISVLTLSALFSLLIGEYWTKPEDGVLAAIMYTGVIATAFAFCIQAWAQRVVPPEIAGLILLLEPVFATIFAFLILRETLKLIEALGAVLILLSVAISV
jgi:drug/metabolite transporter (DMT)-like permease